MEEIPQLRFSFSGTKFTKTNVMAISSDFCFCLPPAQQHPGTHIRPKVQVTLLLVTHPTA